MTDKTGGPAFACAAENGHQAGMSLRDFFAAAAMQGFLSNAELLASTFQVNGKTDIPMIARVSYESADAMLKEREK